MRLPFKFFPRTFMHSTALLSLIMLSGCWPLKVSSPFISQEHFVPHAYEQLKAADPDLKLSTKAYEQLVAWYHNLNDVEFFKITYTSDGRKVVGILAQPHQMKGKHPVVIYNHGGCGESGKITVQTIHDDIYFLAHHGYIVIASQYQGNDGSEGKDELGGADVQDVLNLIPLIKQLPHADPHNIFMFGFSRGGMMSFMALKQHIPVRAAATSGAVSDLFLLEQQNPDLKPLLEIIIPTSASHTKEEAFEQRSAVLWADKLTVPILLLHGTDDKLISVQHAQELANALTKHGKPHKLIIYPGDDHGLHKNRDAAHQEILNWFEQHKN